MELPPSCAQEVLEAAGTSATSCLPPFLTILRTMVGFFAGLNLIFLAQILYILTYIYG